MSLVKLRRSYAYSAAAIAIAAAAFTAPAMATSTTVTVDEANVLNLLSPFLNLNATTTGQNTLALNLSQAIATNQAAMNLAPNANGTVNIYGQPTIAAEAISEKTIFSAASGSITQLGGTLSYYGPAANLAGGLPQQALQNGQSFSGSGNLTVTTPVAGTIYPYQAVGGLGSLGGAYQSAVNPYATTTASANYVTSTSNATANPVLTGPYQTQNVVNLLVNAYSFTSTDLGVAKYYFANGTTNGTSTAVAPAGYTPGLPTANGYPNLTSSVYDVAYGVNNTQSQQNQYGDSRPVQAAASSINQFDPNAITNLTGNPSFPSGHTTYAFTDSILIGMMAPQYFQSMLLSASEYGNSRIDLGVHYPLDIIASRAFVQYDLAQLLNAASTSSTYGQSNNSTAWTSTTTLGAQFASAATSLNGYLSTQTGSCGGSIAACAASNPYNAYSASTYAYQGANNSAIYQYRMTYGLPTLSYTAAPREQAPTDTGDASILLSTLYGGSSAQAKALANAVTGGTTGAGIYGSLSTATINEIIVNTEGNALAAFYGTDLSYWSRIDLYDAAGYFSDTTNGITSKLLLTSGDVLNVPVTVGNGGVFGGTGTVNGNLTFKTGSAFEAQGSVSSSGVISNDKLTVNGNLLGAPGSAQVLLDGTFLPGKKYVLMSISGTAVNPFAANADFTATNTLMTVISANVQVGSDPIVWVTPQSNFASLAQTPNQKAVSAAIDTADNAGTYGTNGAILLNTLINHNTNSTAPAAFNALGGEGLTGQQQTALNAGNLFVTTVLGQATFWSDDRSNDIFGLKDGGGSLKDGPGYDGAIAGKGRIWASGFGQYGSLDGETSTGSASLTSRSSGVAGGIDYQATRNLLVGIAGGESSSSFSVDDRSTTGTVDGGHFGLYGVARSGGFYAAGTVDYARYDNTTSRTINYAGGVGIEQANARFSSDEWLARFEGGYKYSTGGLNVTPFAGFQFASLSNDAFSETSVIIGGGAGVAGLHVNAATIDSDKSFAGVQFDTKMPVYQGWLLTPYARFSWEHEFSPDRRDTASLLSLPATFTIDGASAAQDVARINAGFKLDISPNVGVFASFDGEFSGRGDTYAGTGGVKIRW